ncbi:MAG: RagB/SusD family nutrient uptake outer membrane protein, partial [Chitinophagaceae bacterium]|nr:RagB/SusD family nutrient uptake outer membrane protein [Chitinophagaceae bacterium]
MRNTVLIVLLFCICSCKKFLHVDSPAGQLGGAELFASDITATSAMLAVYTQLEYESTAFHIASVTGQTSDELLNHRTSADWIAVQANSLTADNSTISRIWNRLYKSIYQCNAVLSGIESSGALSPATRSILRGEALFTRAWCHFYLASLFSHIPYVTSTDPFINTSLSQIAETDAYTHMVTDLEEARNLLKEEYLTAQHIPGGERIRPNRYAAEALLSRIYLYQRNWPAAATAATKVISRTNQYSLVNDLSKVFLKNSTEAIWQWQPTIVGFNTYDGGMLNSSLNTPSYISLTPKLYQDFQLDDARRQQWIRQTTVAGQTYYWPFKYRVGQGASSITEYSIILRLSEQYLIRAEARARGGDLPGSEEDLYMIRSRAGLPRVTLTDLPTALELIARERRLELFTETGDRWLDLRRTGKVNDVLAPIKGANWAATDTLYPI